MLKVLDTTTETEETPATPTLDDLAREGARRMLMAALQVEVAQYVDAYQEARDARGRRLVVRHGQAEARKVTCGAGTVEVRAPRVNDKRVDATGQRERFTSRILPPYMRRSPKVAEVLPILYLRGLSTGDFREALPVLLGDDAAGLSATNIARLTAVWEDEYRQFRQRDLADRDYVYVWVDGIHFNIRLEDDRLCTLVVIGARVDGTKELVALEDGYRESAESWAELLRGLQRRGLEAPVVAVGDGALGFWSAVRDVWPQTAEQRDWFHKLGNVLDKLPKRLQPKAKRALHDILAAETREQAEEHLDTFVAEYEAKYPKAAACLATDREALLTLLRLSGRTLDSSPDHERHRIAVRHGPLAATGHQGGRLSHQGPTDGLQVARHGPAAVAATQCRTPAAARAGWCGLHRRSAAGTKHRGGSEGSRLITLIADPQLLTISPRVHTLTEATGDDATTALDLLTAVEGPLVRVTADAAYDTVAVYETAGARGATVVIPPARTATVSGHGPRSPARDRTITLVKTLGRRQWKKASGYHRQGRVENAFFRYKSIIGDGLRARSPAGQGSEVVLGCEILNRMTALGRPVSYRIGR